MIPCKEELELRINEGKLNVELIEIYQVSATTITNWLKRYGLVKNRPKTKYIYDRDFFNIIDTEEKAYVLGFLYADGYINLAARFLEIRLHPKDIDTLEKIRDCLSSNHPITNGVNNLGRDYIQYRVYDKPMLYRLAELGCMNKKSLILTFPFWLPAELKKHFIRGYYDGDGCIHIRKDNGYPIVSIVGTRAFVEGIQEIYSDISSYISKKGNVFIITFNCSNALLFLDKIYSDSTIYMQRKYDKFTEVKSIN